MFLVRHSPGVDRLAGVFFLGTMQVDSYLAKGLDVDRFEIILYCH